jgi:galactokinase
MGERIPKREPGHQLPLEEEVHQQGWNCSDQRCGRHNLDVLRRIEAGCDESLPSQGSSAMTPPGKGGRGGHAGEAHGGGGGDDARQRAANAGSDTSPAADAFLAHTGRRPEGVWSAPGRVNLIGEHTDYNEGFVLPFALHLRTAVAAARRDDHMLCVRSRQRPDERMSIPLDALAPGAVEGWAAYVAGVVWSLHEADHGVEGVDLVVDGAVPAGAGLASSAAIECAVALALADLYDVAVAPASLARVAQRAENDFVGVPCGLMDQMVSMLATAGHALFFDTRSGATEQIGFDPAAAGLTLLVLNTHAKHSHARGAYADLRQACATAAARLGVAALRDVSTERLDEALAALAGAPVLARKVRHVVTENARTVRTAELLRQGRLAEIGPLLTSSHASLRDDLEVSTPALDMVVDAAMRAGALGARMTGGGFGGCAIALVADGLAPAMVEEVSREALARGFSAPTAMPAVPSAGARRDA